MNAHNQKATIAQLDKLKAERAICRTSADALAAPASEPLTPERLAALTAQHQRSNDLDAQIEELLRSDATDTTIAQRVVEAALASSGRDNTTAVVVELH